MSGLSGLNKDTLYALNKQNQRSTKRGFGKNKMDLIENALNVRANKGKMDDIENALNMRASKGDLRQDYRP